MFISHGIWLLRTRKLRMKAKNAGVAFDEFPEAVEWQDKSYDVGLERLWRSLKQASRGHPDGDPLAAMS